MTFPVQLPVSRSQRPTLGALKKTKIDLSHFSISAFNFEPFLELPREWHD